MQAISSVAVPVGARVSEAAACDAAVAYVAAKIDPSFKVVDGELVESKRLGRAIWQFLIRCEQGALATVAVDAQNSSVIPLTGEEIRYVFGEYARRQADSYLCAKISLFHSAIDGVFTTQAGSTAGALWRFAVQVRLPRLGVLGITGGIDVDAQSGEVVPLSTRQINQIRKRTDALVGLCTQTAER
jgi:hypothetical protein